MKYLYLLGVSLVVATPAWGQDSEADTSDPSATELVLVEPLRDDYQTLVVTGSKQHIDYVNRATSVVSREELDRVQGPDLTRTIERLPGVSLARSGGLGSQTSLFVRGANSEDLMVLIDGVPVSDEASPSGGFDLGTLSASGVGKVELLRGPNSLIWGANALGGVMAISSDEVHGKRASIEYGANNSLDAQGGLMIGGYGDFANLNLGYTRSDGISAFAGGSEKDPFRQLRLSGHGRLELDEHLSLVGSARYTDSTVDFDGYPPPTYSVFADTSEYQTTHQASGRIGLDYYKNYNFSLKGGVSYSRTSRAYYDRSFGNAPNFNTQGDTWRVDLRGHANLSSNAGLSLDFGGDSNWSEFTTTFDSRQTARISGLYGVLTHQGDQFSFSAGARFDDHDRFGSHWTFGADAGWRFGRDWNLHASWGQGFKAPTLYQLYGYGGNNTLRPETSNGFELGISKSNRNGWAFYSVTLFRRDSTDMIDYTFPAGYFNVGKTRAQGVEVEGGWRVTDRLNASVTYSYVEATNRVTGKKLARRPQHTFSLSADWTTPLNDLSLGLDLRVVGDRFDDAGNFTPLDSYGLLTLRASVPVGEHFELYGRIENVTDEQYETVSGYGTYGRSAYAGIRLKW